jgi:hypothetical protein
MSDFIQFKRFTEELPENGQKIVYTFGELRGCTMGTFRYDLVRQQGDVFNHTAILRLDSGAYVIQLLPENIGQFKWCAVNE